MKIMKMVPNRVLSSCNMEFVGQTKKEIQDNLLQELASGSLVKYFYRKQAIFIRKFKDFPFADRFQN